MAKIASPRAELAVLRGATHKDKKIAGTILGSIDETYFDNPESIELLDAMRKHMANNGEVPTYRLMIDDPDISSEARSFFRDSEPIVQSPSDALKAVKILNRYRQTRGLYQLAATIDQELQKSKVDIDALMDSASTAVTNVRLSKSLTNAFTHFGTSNSSMELVKKLLYETDTDDTIPTGIKPFDEQSGGVMRGSLVTIGATSGGGKCGILDTRIQLSTLVIETDEFTMECEPEERIVLTSGEVKLAAYLCAGDDIETCPEEVKKHLFASQPRT